MKILTFGFCSFCLFVSSFGLFAFNPDTRPDTSKEVIELGRALWILAEHRPHSRTYQPLSKVEIEDIVRKIAQKEWAAFGCFGPLFSACIDGPTTKHARSFLTNIEFNRARVDRSKLALPLQAFYFGDAAIEFEEVDAVHFTGGTLAIGGTLNEKNALKRLGLPVGHFCIINALKEDGVNYIADVTNSEHMQGFFEFDYAIAHAIPINAEQFERTLVNCANSLGKRGVLIAKFLVDDVELSEDLFLRSGFKQIRLFPANDGEVSFIAAKSNSTSLKEWLGSDAAKPFLKYFHFN